MWLYHSLIGIFNINDLGKTYNDVAIIGTINGNERH